MDERERFAYEPSADDDAAFARQVAFLQQEQALLAGMQRALGDIEERLREMAALARAARESEDEAARLGLSARFEQCKAEIDAISLRADDCGNRYLEGGLDGVRRAVDGLQKYLDQNFANSSRPRS